MDSDELLTAPTLRQRRFLRAVLFTLVDLTVLNLFAQYWGLITISSFMVSLLTAILLQSLLKTTLAIEHRIADYFRPREGRGAVVGRVLATWIVLFGSKFVILEVVDIVLGDRVDLGGVGPFILLVVVMLATEAIVERIYRALA
jgi:hypothetical protein